MVRSFSTSVCVLATFFVSSFIATKAFSNVTCPEALNLSAKIEPLLNSNRIDAEFSILSGNHFEELFTLNPGEDRDQSGVCSFTALKPGQSITSGRFLQIRNCQNGKISIEVEGYTPEGNLYSIRSRLPNQILTGEIAAIVYAGPQTSRNILGRAVLQIFQVVQVNDRKI